MASTANKFVTQPLVVKFDISLIKKNKNKNCPKTDPRGTPVVLKPELEKYDTIQPAFRCLNRMETIPIPFSLCHTCVIFGVHVMTYVSNLFDISKRRQWSDYHAYFPTSHRSQGVNWSAYWSGPSTHWGRDNMVAISLTTLSSAFSPKKISEIWLKFHWSLFLRVQLTIFQHCFR